MLTNVVVASDPRGPAVIERLRRLAFARSTKYVPVMLRCDLDEPRRRVSAPERAARHEWVDSDGVESFVTDEELLQPEVGVIDVDVTELTPSESATRILRHAGVAVP